MAVRNASEYALDQLHSKKQMRLPGNVNQSFIYIS